MTTTDPDLTTLDRLDQIEARARDLTDRFAAQRGSLVTLTSDHDVPALVAAVRAVLDVADEWDEVADKWPYAHWHDSQKANAASLRQAVEDALGGESR